MDTVMTLYHVWFSTKNRKWLLQGDIAEKVHVVMKQVASERALRLLEMESMVDHMHLLLDAESAIDLSRALKLLKGRSAYEVFRAFPELKHDAHVNSLWQDGFKSRTVPPAQLEIVARYIRTQDQRLEKYER